jgi:hypothetical protein
MNLIIFMVLIIILNLYVVSFYSFQSAQIIIIILPLKSIICLFFKINDIFLKFLNYDINNINYNKNNKIYNT